MDIERIAQRELASELDGLLAELALNKDRKEIECSTSANKLRLAHKEALVIYAHREFTRALPLLAGLVRAFSLKRHALGLDQYFTTQNGAFSEYAIDIEKTLFNEVNTFLKQLADLYPLRVGNEPKLAEIGLYSPPLKYVNEQFLSSPCARSLAFRELREREAQLKNGGPHHD
ncbi:hypothetical protein [Serratia aquatilis]|uniref:Uncharacterized protein n=1 Tax=Serratia aquatilis TaxID=1737515 RepID=A0ABV6EJC6_9GAMM